MREIGIGVVSLGWMGRLHSSSYQRLPSRFPELGIRPRLVVAAGLDGVRYLERWQVPERESGLVGLESELDRLLACLPSGSRPLGAADAGLAAALRGARPHDPPDQPTGA